MKITGLGPQNPPQKPDGKHSVPLSSQRLPLDPKEAQDRANDPLQSAFEQLAEKGLRASLDEPKRIRENLKAGFEALVSLKTDQDDEIVLSIREESEVGLYTALKTGAPVENRLADLHQTLAESELLGSQYYFQRKSQILPTDSASASLALARGSRVAVRRADGESQIFKSAEQAKTFLSADLDPDRVARAQKLAQAKAAGLTVHLADENSETESVSVPRLLLKQLSAMFKDDLVLDQDLLKALETGKRVDVSFAKDERPMVIPATLNEAGFESALAWETTPSDDMKAFSEAFERLSGEDTIFMARQGHGQVKGMVLRADARSAFLNLQDNEPVVALDKSGNLHRLESLQEFQAFLRHGKVPGPEHPPFDGHQTPSDNLFMMYHVSPFDPIEKGNYDDLPLRLTELGSNPAVDIVTMRSDLPTKRNLRVDRIQKGGLEELQRLDPELAMSDPKTLENFIYETVRANLEDGKIRLLVGGHGGAEKGLLPDGEHNNAAADNAMPVDEFAGAIKRGLDRVEEETGKRPKIDNLILVSCLMGNTSFIHALAQTGDIETLVASPELMMGNNPISTFSHLQNPSNSKADSREYAKFLVDEYSHAPAMPGGNPSLQHAPTIGAYDLSPKKAERFQEALNGFFEAALAEPEYAKFVKEGIAKSPTYGMNPIMNLMFDVDNRDLYQVIDRIENDARIKSESIKEAISELKEATLDQVIDQKVSEKYEGRLGPSLYLPVDRWDYSEKMGQTELLKGTRYQDFMEMIFDAPLQRGAGAQLLSEVERILHTTGASLMPSVDEQKADAVGESAGRNREEEIPMTPDGTSVEEKLLDQAMEFLSQKLDDAKQIKELRSLEEDTKIRPLRKIAGFARGAIRTGVTLAGAAVGGVIGAVPSAVVGGILGLRAGLTGTSAAGTSKPRVEKSEKDPSPDSPAKDTKASNTRPPSPENLQTTGATEVLGKLKDESTEAQGSESPDKTQESEDDAPETNKLLETLLENLPTRALAQLALWPAEAAGLSAYSNVGYRFGTLPGRVVGALVGATVGALGAAMAGGLAGAAGGGLAGYLLGRKTTSHLELPALKQTEDLYLGRFGDQGKPKVPTEHLKMSENSGED